MFKLGDMSKAHKVTSKIMEETVKEIAEETGINITVVEDIINRYKSKVGKRVKDELLDPLLKEHKEKIDKLTGEKNGGDK